MSYRFEGFLIQDYQISEELPLNEEYTVRTIVEPFQGSGVYMVDRFPEQPDLEQVLNLAERLLPMDGNWLFLHYQCWGGLVDDVWGFVNREESTYGPVIDSSRTATESFLEIMGAFGIDSEAAQNFKPFTRGFWGEDVLFGNAIKSFC